VLIAGQNELGVRRLAVLAIVLYLITQPLLSAQ
jgi:hypothetical protein